MKSFISFSIVQLLISMQIGAQDYHFKNEFLAKWKNSKEYTLKVASLMPEGHYDFSPAQGVRTFGEQLDHISEAMVYHAGLSLNISTTSNKGHSKETILRNLKDNFEKVEQAILQLDEQDFEEKVKFWDGPTTQRKLLELTYDHITHHRAQAIIYLRMKDIKPPNYIGW
ncbi:MAG: DinB family protein [Fulvivirga sp.]